MRLALSVARKAEHIQGAAEIGCVIVRDGVTLATAHNETGLRHDPTAHAEMVAIRRACSRLQANDLRGATLYSTLQPCGMCTMALIWAKIGRVVYGAGRGDVHRMYFEDRHFDTADFIADAFRDGIELRGGVLAEECRQFYAGPNDAVPVEEQANL